MNITLKEFNCSWCNVPEERGSSFCSDEAGLHRRRQDWLLYGCKTPNPDFYCGPINSTKLLTERLQPAVLAATGGVSDQAGRSSGLSTKVKPDVLKVPGANPDKDVHFTADHVDMESKKSGKSHGLSSGGVVCLLFVIISVACLVGWLAYAYNNPHSRSGQFLIRYRPTRWHLGDSRSDIRVKSELFLVCFLAPTFSLALSNMLLAALLSSSYLKHCRTHLSIDEISGVRVICCILSI
ncbi:hypothetical protein D918_08300 [Trichuris suis]|nr:hypothetical protein D918_08300 [Trichuris suis]